MSVSVSFLTDDLMTVQEAAKVLRTQRTQMYRWINSGRIIAIRFGGIHFIPTSEVERFGKVLAEAKKATGNETISLRASFPKAK